MATAAAKKVPADWREARRQSARDAIVDAAWELVRAEGLAGLSIRELAKQAGITTPTVYAYFESKSAIYDAMFGQAATEFVEYITAPEHADDPRAVLLISVHRFVDFCTADPTRYQLLFQRTIPDFEPSSDSYEPAVRALEASRQRLAANGIEDPRHFDLWTALTTGLVNQQISNDPDGTRWSSLVEESVDMFLADCGPTAARALPFPIPSVDHPLLKETTMPTPAKLHHLAITVTDLDASIPWYENVFGITYRMDAPHEGGVGKLLATDTMDLVIVLHRHDTNDGGLFSETVTGLDHPGFFVPTRDDLVQWQDHLEANGVVRADQANKPLTQSPIADEAYGSVLVFRDPDNIQLELFSPAGQ